MHHIDRLKQVITTYLEAVTPGSILAFGLGYLCLQSILRFRRERALIRRYRRFTASAPNNDSKPSFSIEESVGDSNGVKVDDGRKGLDLSKMSFLQASEIQRDLSHLEFPYTFGHSLELGFIQVCTLAPSDAARRLMSFLRTLQTLAFPYPAKIPNDTRQISRPDAMPKRLADTSVRSP